MGNKQDEFAQIAAGGIRFRDGVAEQAPLEKKAVYFTPSAEGVFEPAEKSCTAEELEQELKKARFAHQMFLQDFAPKAEDYRKRQYITEFDWRMQTDDDIKNFAGVLAGNGNWETVSAPHYGGPIGKATAFYRAVFRAEVPAEKCLFLVLKGVDYIAKVFVNGSYLGSHEGFFAPFAFDITPHIKMGENTLLVVVENDVICKEDGNKLYAATGLGYDDPAVGWHHCPPGMGICQDVYLEERSVVHVHDIFVRPLVEEKRAEAWIELFYTGDVPKSCTLSLSVYGQNFQTQPMHFIYHPNTTIEVGMGDSLTEADRMRDGSLGKRIPLLIANGINTFKIPFDMPEFRQWSPAEPWLYQIQVTVLDEAGDAIDCRSRQFGMRSFSMDTAHTPKGMLYLNGETIRLRGANTMGHEQQCVFHKDVNQLIDDILLTKLCNMNFWRLTQRPVQEEVYDYCDRLGLMTQTDLPLFGVLRRNQFCEAIRQVEEMERLIRSHPCNIMVSYINEPFPNASNRPHLHLERHELTAFFQAADLTVRLANPDRVIKQIDGDYDPPSYGLPDNHCYPAWYNGHGIDVGKLNKGYWLPTKPDWYHGCGEFGAEGLDPVAVMKKYYPKQWLPNEKDEAAWSPREIVRAQTGDFHYFFYDTPKTLSEWVEKSQEHQAWATRFMTEAFRRDTNMITFAIHLGIDAFPAGWMKSIMDVERTPKSAYFAYREALTPLMANIRTDRFTFFAGEQISLEAWICNDTNTVEEETVLKYYASAADGVIASGILPVQYLPNSADFYGDIRFAAPAVAARTKVRIHLALFGAQNTLLHDTSLEIEVFPKANTAVPAITPLGSAAERLARELCADCPENGDVFLISDLAQYEMRKEELERRALAGATVLLIDLPIGKHSLFGSDVTVKPCSMLPVHFVSRNTGHSLTAGFAEGDFRLWYDEDAGYITPLLHETVTAKDFTPILMSGNLDESGNWAAAPAALEKQVGSGMVRICQVRLPGRVKTNPVAYEFCRRILKSTKSEKGKGISDGK